jgi:hypothetical protein
MPLGSTFLASRYFAADFGVRVRNSLSIAELLIALFILAGFRSNRS